MTKKGITIQYFPNKIQGLQFVKETLYKIIHSNTLLLLSGGSTPKPLYTELSEEKELLCAAVALIDERYGKPYHEKSNEKMIEESGFIGYLNARDIPFYGILENKSLEQAAEDYDKTIDFLFEKYEEKVAIMGIGTDGHTAGLPAGFKNYDLRIMNQKFVDYFDDFPGEHTERITLTFNALQQVDTHIILAFGQDKKDALEKMFAQDLLAGSEEEIPSRFYMRPDVAEKTLLITDIKL